MTDLEILISDLHDIADILGNNGYGAWCASICKAIELLKKQMPKKVNKVKLPCRCGRIRTRTSYGYGEYYGKVVITCPGCGEIVTGDTEEEAIENWNRRNRKDED